MGNSPWGGQGRTVVLPPRGAGSKRAVAPGSLSGEAGLAGSGRCLTLFPVFPRSCLVWWEAVVSKQHVQLPQLPRIRGHVAAMSWGLPWALFTQMSRGCCLCPRETNPLSSETSLLRPLGAELLSH